jgi:glutamate--cysteine ligase
VKPEGTFQQLLDFFHRNANDVVLKPLKGTGGLDVFRCRSSKELEIAAMRIFAREYGLAACPFISLGHEYRAIVLAGEVKLVYRKRRATVVADGKTSVENLILEKMKTTKASWSAVAEAINAFSQAELKSIPKTGEIPIQWKHNLGLGLSEVDLELEDSLCTEIGKLAVAAATAIGITFCSVDVAETQEALIVVEVNAGVMMDVFANDSTRRHIARQVYEDAIQLCFDRLPK